MSSLLHSIHLHAFLTTLFYTCCDLLEDTIYPPWDCFGLIIQFYSCPPLFKHQSCIARPISTALRRKNIIMHVHRSSCLIDHNNIFVLSLPVCGVAVQGATVLVRDEYIFFCQHLQTVLITHQLMPVRSLFMLIFFFT